ncbi:MAG: hypothetical protein DRI94_11085 [Bacteroidetes bacterium]|nr:MAG: hypothetical protein DRI94_11085 [Bacteroidota bacterium]
MISFLYPSFLWASFLIAIPIIIHLFNFRRYKTVYFSNVSFLQDIKQQTQSKSRLRHILVLLARIFFILALVIAFAQPVKFNKSQVINNLPNKVAIYIDNSYSTNLESQNGKVIELEKKYAKSIIDAYNTNADFYIFTNEPSSKNNQKLNKKKAVERVLNVNSTHYTVKLSNIIDKVKDIITESNKSLKSNKIIYLVSDMQKSTADINKLNPDTLSDINIVPVFPQSKNNLFIDTCWFDNPTHKINQQEVLNITITNSSNDNYNKIPVKLFINDSLKAFSNFDISKNQSKTIQLNYNNYKTGLYDCRVEISDFPIVYDNTLFLSYKIKSKINLLDIFENQPNKYISALFKDDDYINLSQEKFLNLKLGSIDTYDAIILDAVKKPTSGLQQIISNFAKQGKPVFIVPAYNINIDAYNELLKSLNQDIIFDTSSEKIKIEKVDFYNSLYKNVFTKKDKNIDFPVIYKYLLLNNSNGTINIFTANNDLPLFTESQLYKSKIYLLAFPLDSKASNFVNHQLFVPTLYNFALDVKNLNQIYYTINKSNYFSVYDSTTSDQVYHIVDKDKTTDIIPRNVKAENKTILNLNNLITKAKNYFVKKQNKIIDILSINYNRKESDLEFYTIKDIEKNISENIGNIKLFYSENPQVIKNEITKNTRGEPLWIYFIILSLIFLLTEILLLRIKNN